MHNFFCCTHSLVAREADDKDRPATERVNRRLLNGERERLSFGDSSAIDDFCDR